MLKKLARYGNSTTLVIDKAILELLNMDETTVVKLHTDGKSLIITPVTQTDSKKISYNGIDALQTSLQDLMEESKKHASALDSNTKLKMQDEFMQVFKKYNSKSEVMDAHQNLSLNEEYQNELAKLAKIIDPIAKSQEYIKEANNLRWKFCPELKEMDNELSEIAKKYRV